MQPALSDIARATSDLQRAAEALANDGNPDTAHALVEAIDAVGATTSGLAAARSLPDPHPIRQRRVTVEEIYFPAVYFDATYNGDKLEALVEELDKMGTCGVPRAITAVVAEKIRRGDYNGLIARATKAEPDLATRYEGVIAAEDFEALFARAIEWADAVDAKYIMAGVLRRAA